jgi:hypothetical protein
MTTSLHNSLNEFLEFRLVEWSGLIPCLTKDIAAIFGVPSTVENVYLGAYPALRETYAVPTSPATGLIIYSRALRVIVVETAKPPPPETLALLGSPDARKAPEFGRPGYFLQEYLYCRRGLVLSVAKSLDTSTESCLKILRCRGIQPLTSAHEYGADYYLALKNSIVF